MDEVESLIAQLKGKDAYVRHYAASTLGNICDPRAIEPLTRTLNDPIALSKKRHAKP